VKRPKNRLEIQKLFLFGAGASYAASVSSNGESIKGTAPLDKDFLGKLSQSTVQRPSWVPQARDSILRNWLDHREIQSFGLEEGIIRQFGHLEVVRSIHKRRTRKYNHDQFLNEITHLICFVLEKAKEHKSNRIYKRLSEIIAPAEFGSAALVKNRVITFNYDTLLDEHLLKRFSAKEVYFDKIKLTQTEPSKRKSTDKFPSPLLVKLHGSINWVCTQSELISMINHSNREEPYVLENVWVRKTKPPELEDQTRAPCIIPPLPNKPITNTKLFRYLWTKAYEYIVEAKEIVICGYSLPQTDGLAVALFGSLTSPKVSKITVIDPDPQIMMKWRGLIRSNKRKISWSYFTNISEYLESEGSV
jgi:hypothetical protein